MLEEAFIKKLEDEFSSNNLPLQIESSQPKSGGSINDAFELKTSNGQYLLKVNHASRYPGMFEKEVNGLILLRHSESIDIPRPLFTGIIEDRSFIVMELIKPSGQSKEFWKMFGQGLARMHQISHDLFGFYEDNYIGSLEQSNLQHETWAEFFIQERLEPLLMKARDLGEMDSESVRRFDKLFHSIDSFFPVEKPSLLHGDLWSGNYMSNEKGEPVIFDPAVYYGHREMDIAMSRLFGGFSTEFYSSYNDSFPLEKAWEERLEICNLYPLLVHVILFGGGYAGSVKQTLRRYA